jgi:hypothetical protein
MEPHGGLVDLANEGLENLEGIFSLSRSWF